VTDLAIAGGLARRCVDSADECDQPNAVQALVDRAKREVESGLLPSAQLSLAYKGEVVMFETLGDATNDTRYIVYSATKAFVAGAV
jgi:CubicO group peptidase (beta-lactamase class C family)